MNISTRLVKLGISATISNHRVTLAEVDLTHLLDVLDRQETAEHKARCSPPADPNDRWDPRNQRS